HLVDGLVPDLLAQALVAPVAAELRVDEVLVDRRELAREDLVESVDDVLPALERHAFLRVREGLTQGGGRRAGGGRHVGQILALADHPPEIARAVPAHVARARGAAKLAHRATTGPDRALER